MFQNPAEPHGEGPRGVRALEACGRRPAYGVLDGPYQIIFVAGRLLATALLTAAAALDAAFALSNDRQKLP
jgi:hypothetical protein